MKTRGKHHPREWDSADWLELLSVLGVAPQFWWPEKLDFSLFTWTLQRAIDVFIWWLKAKSRTCQVFLDPGFRTWITLNSILLAKRSHKTWLYLSDGVIDNITSWWRGDMNMLRQKGLLVMVCVDNLQYYTLQTPVF